MAKMTLGLLALAACEETMTAATPDRLDGGLPDPAQSTCMAAVADETGEGNVEVLGTRAARDGTEVVIGVGEDRLPWRCVAGSEGNVEQVAPVADATV